LLSQIDLMATLATVVGADLPEAAAPDSFSQLTLLKGGNSSRTALVHNTKANHYAIRQGDWVLIDAPSGAVTKVPAWFDQEFNYPENVLPAALYDLSRSVAQRENLYASHPEKARELRALLAQIRNADRTRP
jgi:arylsulfatase A